ncbi:helix-turn-helix domain-containing protein [Amycolatopsis sp. CA-230715]|uniref:AraC-like ligand-binding domain-containing protein n=1 Tax=Amycolatopsis sp. CA-230715 TaxID=2745196 RepID=UPI001C009540|nr:helix-turn-helix domain-containing protein [Amycolatopsis sp. CA-230715]QWF85358.1 Transcriptional activator NphR [Amycolatopsis sp. CA-230715]
MTAAVHPATTVVAKDFTDFRTAVSQSFVPLQVTTEHDEHFRGRIRSCAADDVAVTEVTASAHVVERTPELIARADRRYFKLSLILAGTGLLVQDGRQALLRPGDVALYDTHRPYSLVFEEDFRTLVVMFPQRLIDLPADLIGQLTAIRMSGKEGVGNVVVPFLAQLGSNLDQLAGPAGVRLAHSAVDLLATMFATELDLAHTTADPHHELMRRIRAHIDANLSSPDLGPAQIAAEHYISTRHLHGLFQEQGTTVSGWIRERRLEHCRRDLLDPVHTGRPVAAVAARWGFVDAAHFSRVFKAAFGRSPSEVRRGV